MTKFIHAMLATILSTIFISYAFAAEDNSRPMKHEYHKKQQHTEQRTKKQVNTHEHKHEHEHTSEEHEPNEKEY